eukprot:scaffold284656_cov28-Tisochrysis_lutea.AAC.4
MTPAQLPCSRRRARSGRYPARGATRGRRCFAAGAPPTPGCAAASCSTACAPPSNARLSPSRARSSRAARATCRTAGQDGHGWSRRQVDPTGPHLIHPPPPRGASQRTRADRTSASARLAAGVSSALFCFGVPGGGRCGELGWPVAAERVLEGGPGGSIGAVSQYRSSKGWLVCLASAGYRASSFFSVSSSLAAPLRKPAMQLDLAAVEPGCSPSVARSSATNLPMSVISLSTWSDSTLSLACSEARAAGTIGYASAGAAPVKEATASPRASTGMCASNSSKMHTSR